MYKVSKLLGDLFSMTKGVIFDVFFFHSLSSRMFVSFFFKLYVCVCVCVCVSN